MRAFPKPLSSDANTSFGIDNKEGGHNERVKEATELLKLKIIPQFAAWLDKQDVENLKANSAFVSHAHRFN